MENTWKWKGIAISTAWMATATTGISDGSSAISVALLALIATFAILNEIDLWKWKGIAISTAWMATATTGISDGSSAIAVALFAFIATLAILNEKTEK